MITYKDIKRLSRIACNNGVALHDCIVCDEAADPESLPTVSDDLEFSRDIFQRLNKGENIARW